MSTSQAETAVSYAALILADAEIAVTAEKLQILLKAAGIEDIEPIWTTLFAKALETKNVQEILTAVATSGPTSGPGVESTSEQQNEEDDESKAENAAEESGDDTDDALGLSLFD